MSYYIIGIPKELKENEKRIVFKPLEIQKLIKIGFSIIIQKDAGALSNYSDYDYINVGAKILDTIEDIYKKC